MAVVEATKVRRATGGSGGIGGSDDLRDGGASLGVSPSWSCGRRRHAVGAACARSKRVVSVVRRMLSDLSQGRRVSVRGALLL